MKLTVKYFASVREALGTGQEVVETSAATVQALRGELVARGGAYTISLAPGRAVRAALNQVMVDGQAPLSEGAELAFFPPVTGG